MSHTFFSRSEKKRDFSLDGSRATDYADAPRCRWRMIFRAVVGGDFPIWEGRSSAVRKNLGKSFPKGHVRARAIIARPPGGTPENAFFTRYREIATVRSLETSLLCCRAEVGSLKKISTISSFFIAMNDESVFFLIIAIILLRGVAFLLPSGSCWCVVIFPLAIMEVKSV